MSELFSAGMAWMLFGVVNMSFMAIGAKLLKLYTCQGVIKVAFVRSFIMGLGAYCHGRFIGKVNPFAIQSKMYLPLFWRCLYGSFAFYFELIALYLMPISLAIPIYFTQPIFAMVIGYIYLNEKMSKIDVVGVFVSMVGVILISNPNLLNQKRDLEDYPYFYYGVVSCLCGALSSGFAYLWMRKIGINTHSSAKPMFFGIFSTILLTII